MTDLSASKLAEQVEVTCYRKTEKMMRREAITKFYEGMKCSEGSEHERYETIFFQLLEGHKTASDEIPMWQL